ncbi:hypothetical protein [Sinosporangium siamense]|uniref:Uncharacterized protein n=1 Tax=Sinosporangium siamense TaxID=1367973 RepID=A0A919VF64_9ACTN|nr:hypothetical protein [Sinosporangium siamense]GII95824.1 hypothetical protein Ssi02_60550 [Sinosporangium siamense]
MSTTLECVERASADVDISEIDVGGEREGKGRRNMLLASASALVAGLATLLNPARAAADCLGSPCCYLASCTRCSYSGSPSSYTCPPGYYKTYWTCVSGGYTYACGECSGGPSCYQGPWPCSIWYRL